MFVIAGETAGPKWIIIIITTMIVVITKFLNVFIYLCTFEYILYIVHPAYNHNIVSLFFFIVNKSLKKK